MLSDDEEVDENNVSDGTEKLYVNEKVESTEGDERTNKVVLNADASDKDTSVWNPGYGNHKIIRSHYLLFNQFTLDNC